MAAYGSATLWCQRGACVGTYPGLSSQTDAVFIKRPPRRNFGYVHTVTPILRSTDMTRASTAKATGSSNDTKPPSGLAVRCASLNNISRAQRASNTKRFKLITECQPEPSSISSAMKAKSRVRAPRGHPRQKSTCVLYLKTMQAVVAKTTSQCFVTSLGPLPSSLSKRPRPAADHSMQSLTKDRHFVIDSSLSFAPKRPKTSFSSTPVDDVLVNTN